MPRRARLDTPGTLHHVIVRGIEKRRIVNDVADRKNFVKAYGGAINRYQNQHLRLGADDQSCAHSFTQLRVGSFRIYASVTDRLCRFV